MKQELDPTNLKILKFLKHNPKRRTAEITTAVDLRSNFSTANRLRYLEYIGLIRREFISNFNENGNRSNHIYWSAALIEEIRIAEPCAEGGGA